MKRRQPPNKSNHRWPTIWLMTDARFGDDLLPAIRRLPFGSGVVFRHYHLASVERRRLFGQVRRICRQRGQMLVLAGSEMIALRWHADGFHCRSGKALSRLPRTAPVHNRAELVEALRNGADLLFISPLFATTSHPGNRALGIGAFNSLARQSGDARVIALGGMNRGRTQMLTGKLVHGWAAIDAFRKTAD
jgi:thiamine-phosphate pyrophosphorylase